MYWAMHAILVIFCSFFPATLVLTSLLLAAAYMCLWEIELPLLCCLERKFGGATSFTVYYLAVESRKGFVGACGTAVYR